MAQALQLAKRGLGKTEPNPAVGCVIVKEGKVSFSLWSDFITTVRALCLREFFAYLIATLSLQADQESVSFLSR